MVAGDLVTVNPVDGSEIEPCPPGKRPAAPVRYGPGRRDELRRAAATPGARPRPPRCPWVPERAEVRERLATLLTRGRSIRLTGPAGSGRTTVLAAVAADCARLAPDGVIRLSGRHRTPTDLLHDLHAAVFDAPRHRLDRAELLAAVREIGAVVVLDDIEFGGAALEDFLDATPECAFLISATPHTPVPSADSHLEEVALAGLSRAACQELLEHHLGGPLDAEEADWATRLWSRSEGLPLRCVQAAALLADRRAGADRAPLPDPAEAAAPGALLAAGLDETGRDVLRLAVALGGECPHPVHLAALTGDERTEDILAELAGRGLVTPAGPRHRLAAGVADELTAAGYAEGAAARAEAVAGHYAWWAGHPEVTPEQVAREADVIVATLSALVTGRDAAAAAAAVPLARAAAPALAAGLAWSAWERALRHGAEAARLAGEVAEEAYFHHDLGILALCTGNLGRARAELEASIGLRGALADRRGAVSGRRALALVADRSGTPAPALPADRPAASEAPAPAPDAAAAGPDRPGAGRAGRPRSRGVPARRSRSRGADGPGRRGHTGHGRHRAALRHRPGGPRAGRFAVRGPGPDRRAARGHRDHPPHRAGPRRARHRGARGGRGRLLRLDVRLLPGLVRVRRPGVRRRLRDRVRGRRGARRRGLPGTGRRCGGVAEARPGPPRPARHPAQHRRGRGGRAARRRARHRGHPRHDQRGGRGAGPERTAREEHRPHRRARRRPHHPDAERRAHRDAADRDRHPDGSARHRARHRHHHPGAAHGAGEHRAADHAGHHPRRRPPPPRRPPARSRRPARPRGRRRRTPPRRRRPTPTPAGHHAARRWLVEHRQRPGAVRRVRDRGRGVAPGPAPRPSPSPGPLPALRGLPARAGPLTVSRSPARPGPPGPVPVVRPRRPHAGAPRADTTTRGVPTRVGTPRVRRYAGGGAGRPRRAQNRRSLSSSMPRSAS
ncbi:ATP-binding protein [Streptomyces pactum]|uniref:ATP-binding protein n=1 Tax=Streptomyces pactum TaxID=68249 RepID=A0ABS0NPE6_9ACTN|nr:ATP-binding protein [Streptomyces pactum]